MKQIEVQIMGQTYVLGCSDDSESTLRQAVAKVDTGMCQIRDAGKIKARDKIAVLVALNIAVEQFTSPSAIVQLTSPTLDSGTSSPSVSADYSKLLAKLDQALAEDGRLL